MARGSPWACMSTTGSPLSAATRKARGSCPSAATSLMMRAPASAARRMTSALRVSMEMGTPTCLARAATTGMTRRTSSSAATGSAPGRVDSPPMSRISAPSASSCRLCATAAPGSSHRPPSEKLSGVTLTIPMRRGRSMARPAMGGRGRWSRCSAGAQSSPALPARSAAAASRRRTASPSRSVSSAAAKIRSARPATASPKAGRAAAALTGRRPTGRM